MENRRAIPRLSHCLYFFASCISRFTNNEKNRELRAARFAVMFSYMTPFLATPTVHLALNALYRRSQTRAWALPILSWARAIRMVNVQHIASSAIRLCPQNVHVLCMYTLPVDGCSAASAKVTGRTSRDCILRLWARGFTLLLQGHVLPQTITEELFLPFYSIPPSPVFTKYIIN